MKTPEMRRTPPGCEGQDPRLRLEERSNVHHRGLHSVAVVVWREKKREKGWKDGEYLRLAETRRCGGTDCPIVA